MTLKLNGVDAYLGLNAPVISTFPQSMAMWVSCDGANATNGDQYWINQSTAAVDRYIGAWTDSGRINRYTTQRNIGDGASAAKNTAPNLDATLRLVVAVFESTSKRTLYFGDNTGVSETTAKPDNLALHDRTTLGAIRYFNGGTYAFANGQIAEAHFYNAALTAADVAALVAKTVKPEDVKQADGITSAWVDGVTLESYRSDGQYASLTGSRTFVAAGGVTAGTATHPVNRNATINLVGTNCTQANTSSAGSVTVTPPVAGVVNLAGSNCAQSNACSTGAVSVTQATATVTSEAFYNWSKVLQANVTIPNVVVLRMDRSVALSLANQVTSGAGVLSITSASLVAGTNYMLATFNADGSARGFKKYTAA